MAIETSTTGRRLLEAHFERLNAAVAAGDFDPMVDALAEDVRMEFANLPVDPIVGREPLKQAYREMPIHDGLDVLSVDEPTCRHGRRPDAVARARGAPAR